MCSSDSLDPWVVLYRPKGLNPIFAPEAFMCRAEDGDHAEEQCVNLDPTCEVVWTYLGDAEDAYKDYWACSMETPDDE
jgi:hypothetical protein